MPLKPGYAVRSTVFLRLLVPVAHMLQHAQDDAAEAVKDLTPDQIWARPGGGASVGFHVRHLMGALDRLFTYARGETLTAGQLSALKAERDAASPPADAATLTAELAAAIARASISCGRPIRRRCSTDARWGGSCCRQTVLGLLVHGGEHSARHAGQAIRWSRAECGCDEWTECECVQGKRACGMQSVGTDHVLGVHCSMHSGAMALPGPGGKSGCEVGPRG